MGHLLIDIAEAVKEYLNAGSFSQSFTATREYIGEAELKDLGTLSVVVVPQAETREISSRQTTDHEYRINVCVRKKVAAVDNTTLDALMSFTAELVDHFRFVNFDDPAATWTGTEHGTEDNPPYLQEHLGEMRQFTSLFTLTYVATR